MKNFVLKILNKPVIGKIRELSFLKELKLFPSRNTKHYFNF